MNENMLCEDGCTLIDLTSHNDVHGNLKHKNKKQLGFRVIPSQCMPIPPQSTFILLPDLALSHSLRQFQRQQHTATATVGGPAVGLRSGAVVTSSALIGEAVFILRCLICVLRGVQ